MNQPDGPDRSDQPPADGERPRRVVVPGQPVDPVEDEETATAVRDLGSASRSCLVIIGILLALALFACVALVLRASIGG